MSDRKVRATDAPVKLSADVTAMVRAIAWFKQVTVAELTRPHLIGPMTAEFQSLPEIARQRWIESCPALQTESESTPSA